MPELDTVRAFAVAAPFVHPERSGKARNGAVSSGRIQSLQVLRAVAALLVVMFHTQATFAAKTGFMPFGGVFRGGGRGVDLFFVLSGFIVTYLHAADWGQPSRLPNYLFNRLSRIYPSVWIVTAVTALLVGAGLGGAYSAGKLTFAAVAKTALLLPQGDTLVAVTWTLKYEMFFYLAFMLLIVRPRFGWPIFVAWQGAVVVWALCGSPALGPAVEFYLQPICLEFSIGMFCAWLVMRPWRQSSPLALQLALLVISIVVFAAGSLVDLYPNDNPARLQDVAIFGSSAGMIVTLLVMLEKRTRLRVPASTVALGNASYAIYLVHYAVVSRIVFAIARLHNGRVPDALCLLVAAAAVGAGLVFDRFADQPLQRFLREYKSRWSATASPRIVVTRGERDPGMPA